MMQISFQKTISDYKKFIAYFSFRHKLYQKLFILITVAAVFNGTERPFELINYLKNFSTAALVVSSLFFLVSYLKSILQLKKAMKLNKQLLEKTTVILTEIGIEIQSGELKELWEWRTIKQVEDLPDYIYITMYSNLYSIFIPKKFFATDHDARLFYVNIDNQLCQSKGRTKHRDGRHLYNWGFLGLIPNVGLVAGFVLLFKGLFTYKNKTLTFIGIAAMSFTVVFWYIFINYITVSSIFDKPTTDLAQSELNQLTKNIEFFHQHLGAYPDSLGQLKTKDEFIFIHDPFLSSTTSSYFHYHKIRDKYTLFSVGVDRLPYTADDIYPTVTKGDTVNFGFVKQ